MSWLGSDDNRTRFLNWQNRVLRYSILSFVLAVAIMLSGTYHLGLNDIQREYLPDYLKASIFSSIFTSLKTESTYSFTSKQKDKDGNVIYPKSLFKVADKIAYQSYNERVFNRTSIWDLNKFPGLVLGFTSFMSILGFLLVKDYHSQKAREKGKLLRGPQLVSPKEFSRLWPLVGQTWYNKFLIKTRLKYGPEKGLTYEVLNAKEKVERLVLPKEAEVKHMAILGATGSGKSTFLKQTLAEIQSRGETAVIYDPVGEMAEIFFQAERGDRILNPLDARCPYIDISSEIVTQSGSLSLAERMDLAQAIFPDSFTSGNSGQFFINSARKIFAFLLKLKLPQSELIKVSSNSESILELASADNEAQEIVALLDPEARGQHGGIMGTLALVADSLRLLPKQGNKAFKFGEWAKTRGPGWLFITGTQNTRTALRPLQSLFFHLLIRRCFSSNQNVPSPVMFVLDELQTLEKLPILETCLTEARKYNCKFIFGCQDKSQLDERYGTIANTILSQPNIQIFLRVSEIGTAKWVSQSVGEAEIERMNPSHTVTPDKRNSISYSSQKQIELLLLPSQITSLASLTGYLKYGDYVVELKLKPQNFAKVAEAFIARSEDTAEPSNTNKVDNKVPPTSPKPSTNSKPNAIKAGDAKNKESVKSPPKIINSVTPKEAIKLAKDETTTVDCTKNSASKLNSNSTQKKLVDSNLPVLNKPSNGDDPMKNIDIIY